MEQSVASFPFHPSLLLSKLKVHGVGRMHACLETISKQWSQFVWHLLCFSKETKYELCDLGDSAQEFTAFKTDIAQ